MAALEDRAAADPAGAGWRCRFCGTLNGVAADHCKSCGAIGGPGPAGPVELGDPAVTSPPSPPATRRPGRPARAWTLAAVAVASALLGALVVFVLRGVGGESVTVSGFEWERSVEIQDRETVREEAWAEEVPEGARVIARRRSVHHTDRQQVGTRDGRPVYRERPVYGQRVAYDVDRWSVTRTLRATGKGKSPRWPDIRLNLGEREGRRSETYVVVLQGRGVHRLEVSRERWLEMREGQMGSAVVRDGVVVDVR